MKPIFIIELVLIGTSAFISAIAEIKKKPINEPDCNGRMCLTMPDGPGGKDTLTCIAVASGWRDCFSTYFDATENFGPINDPSTTSLCLTLLW